MPITTRSAIEASRGEVHANLESAIVLQSSNDLYSVHETATLLTTITTALDNNTIPIEPVAGIDSHESLNNHAVLTRQDLEFPASL